MIQLRAVTGPSPVQPACLLPRRPRSPPAADCCGAATTRAQTDRGPRLASITRDPTPAAMASSYILGISAFYHDSAACLLHDGEIVAAAQEERFTREKGDASFPRHAVDYCLAAAGIRAADLSHVGFYDKPLLK